MTTRIASASTSTPPRPGLRLVGWAFLPYAVVSIVHVVLLGVGSDLAGPTKLALMPLLAVPVLVAVGRLRPWIIPILLLAAIVFSWLGDGAGAFFPDGPELPLMLLFFGIAHVFYIVLFLRFLAIRRLPLWSLVYVIWWVAMILILGPHTGSLLIPVALYGVILGGTAAMATRSSPVIIWGAVFFLISDTILAFRLFLSDSMPAWTSPAVMATYTLGQGLIIAGAVFLTARRSAQPRHAESTPPQSTPGEGTDG